MYAVKRSRRWILDTIFAVISAGMMWKHAQVRSWRQRKLEPMKYWFSM